MSALPPELEAAVQEQAEARVNMDVRGYAQFLTPEAVDSLRASFPGIPPRVSRYAVDTVDGGGSDYTIDVRYFIRDESFVVRSKWKRLDGDWKVVHAERLWSTGERRPGFLSRLAGAILRPLARLRR